MLSTVSRVTPTTPPPQAFKSDKLKQSREEKKNRSDKKIEGEEKKTVVWIKEKYL